MTPAPTVVVDGDVTVDWSLARRSREGGAPGLAEVRANWHLGRAALLAELVERVAGSSGRQIALVRPPAAGTCRPDAAGAYQSWTLWSPGGRDDGWWVERQLGVTRAPDSAPGTRPATCDADLVVLDDAGLGFRDQPDRWPAAVAADQAGPWLLVKTGAPVASGPLWQHLSARHNDRVVAVVSAQDLRRSRVQISRGLSWERTAQDVAWELANNPDVRVLARCAHVVVQFGAAGAIVVSRPEPPTAPAGSHPPVSLIFDPAVMEGEWERDRPGGVIGGVAVLTAFLASGVLGGCSHDRLADAAGRGLTAVRYLLDGGYRAEPDGGLAFPFGQVVAAGTSPGGTFDRVAVRDPARLLAGSATQRPPGVAAGAAAPGRGQHGFWTILEEAYPGTLDEVARQVVISGPASALHGVPYGRFGHLLTVNRHEIEALRAIRGLMEQYCGLDRPGQPLSIAVFGPPGSGKSFGVTQVATSLLPGRVTKLEFNLSQLGSPDELADALHQVRDVSLTGQIPLVFWDEFDTPLAGQPLGWLRYFLAPMQDGAFRQGQLTHPIGRSIFVFAGGTAASISEFGRDLSEEQRRAAKQPDFVSRLRGYLNVLGPNPQPAAGEPGGDRFHVLRRAILLQSLLSRKAPQLLSRHEGQKILSLDPGVLRAFLEVPSYRHGARSMEAIIDMSQLAGNSSFQRSSLPSQAQLDLHVNGPRFLALVHRLDLTGDLLEQLAAAAHDVYCEDLEGRGYQLGPARDEARKISPSLRPYTELPEEDKEQNRASVRDIPAKLAKAGYVMTPAKSEEASSGFPGDLLDQLAEDEHERWVNAKAAAGWTYGTPTDQAARRHEAMVPWADLPDSQKAKDRALVAGIPAILSRCGYAVIPIPP